MDIDMIFGLPTNKCNNKHFYKLFIYIYIHICWLLLHRVRVLQLRCLQPSCCACVFATVGMALVGSTATVGMVLEYPSVSTPAIECVGISIVFISRPSWRCRMPLRGVDLFDR